MLIKTVFLISLPLCFTVDVTFKNTTFRGYDLYTEKFKKTIRSSNSLKECLPKSEFIKIEFKEQNIPILYENSLADLDYLDELVIEYCQVHEIRPGALRNISLLRSLSLKGNKLKEIKEGVFNNLTISSLDLSLNSITNIQSGALDDLPNILYIKLYKNLIAKWNPNWFKNTPLLTKISMENNSISKLPNGAFANLKGDKKLSSADLTVSIDLTVNIILSYNKIKVIEPKAFRDLSKINDLWLDHNKIEDFGENLLDNVDVKELRLDNNNIRCLDGDLSKVIKAVTTYLYSNPFDCKCLNKIKVWAKKNGKDVHFFFSGVKCAAQSIKNKETALEKN